MEVIGIQARQIKHDKVQEPGDQLAGTQVHKTVARPVLQDPLEHSHMGIELLARASTLLNSCVADSLSIT